MDGFQPLRSILSAFKTSAHKIARFLVPISSVTINECTVKESLHFVREILEQDSSLFMRRLNVDSLFFIDIYVKSVFQNPGTLKGFNKNKLRQSLYLATKELHLSIEGMAMGSPLKPTLSSLVF